MNPLPLLFPILGRIRKESYYRQLVKQYRSPLSKLAESYSSYERRERAASEKHALARFELDRKLILSFALDRFSIATPGERCADRILSAIAALAGLKNAQDRQLLAHRIDEILGSCESTNKARNLHVTDHADAGVNFENDRLALVRAILDRVLDINLAPRFHDYDYLDDAVGIIAARYCSDKGCHIAACSCVLNALCVLVGDGSVMDWDALPQGLRRLLGADHGYRPPRGDVSKHVWNVIPDMAEEFIALKAEQNVARFLEINREYSKRQAVGQGLWDSRDLSLLRGYERDHHLLLRTLVALIQEGHLSRHDEVLLVGPRHVDEVAFFRKCLGLPKTIGLDLFEYGKNEILAGDMHRMPFESGRFKLVYCAGTLSYSYNVRRVIDEIARVSKRPAFVFLIDAAGRQAGPDALGRSDILGIETLIGLFYRYSFEVLAKDAGRSLAPELYENEPCLALRLHNEKLDFPKSTNLTRYLQRQQ